MFDEQLIKACIKNERTAQKELVCSYAPVLLTVARRYLFAVIEPEDILQESFILIFKNLDQFDPNKGKLVNWMSRIVINTALNYTRSVKYKLNGNDVINEKHEETYGEEAGILNEMDAESLMDHINQLPEPYKQIFNLAAIDGYKHDEISKMLQIEEATSRSYLHRARKMLIAQLQTFKNYENEFKSIR